MRRRLRCSGPVSHDLRSPLTAIGTASEMLSDPRERLSPSDRDELLASIRDQARRLDRLVANLLDLSRLEAGAASPVVELWTVDELVGACAGGDRRPTVTASSPRFPTSALRCRVDAAQLERVLVNLVENALGYSSPSDPVEVRAVVADGEVVISRRRPRARPRSRRARVDLRAVLARHRRRRARLRTRPGNRPWVREPERRPALG